jgi:hypothetical protein
MMGQAATPLKRYLSPVYADGVNTPIANSLVHAVQKIIQHAVHSRCQQAMS